MNVRLSKIKLKDRRIFISWEKYEEKTESWDEYSMRSADPALPSLYETLGKLDHHIAEICELPKECEQTIEATGVSFSYDDDGGRGCVITGKKLLQSNPAPVNLNTPCAGQVVPRRNHDTCRSLSHGSPARRNLSLRSEKHEKYEKNNNPQQ